MDNEPEGGIKVQVDLNALDEMPIETLDKFDKAGNGTLSGGELLDLLDGLIVGGVRGHGYKMQHLQLIAQAVSKAVRERTEGGASAGA